MILVTTKYIGPSNTKGSRVKATLYIGKVIYRSFDHSLSSTEAHKKVAREALALSGYSSKVNKHLWVDNDKGVLLVQAWQDDMEVNPHFD